MPPDTDDRLPGTLAILETVLYAEDLDAVEAFYTQVLGLPLLIKEAGRHVFFRCPGSMLLVFNPSVTETVRTEINGFPVPLHGAHGPGHMAFRESEARLDQWRDHLARHGIAVETDMTWPNGARSLYFRDPAGNSIEIATPDLWGFDA
ncbi:MAG: VOC family protein [Alphaproteobacteria bacterium]